MWLDHIFRESNFEIDSYVVHCFCNFGIVCIKINRKKFRNFTWLCVFDFSM